MVTWEDEISGARIGGNRLENREDDERRGEVAQSKSNQMKMRDESLARGVAISYVVGYVCELFRAGRRRKEASLCAMLRNRSK